MSGRLPVLLQLLLEKKKVRGQNRCGPKNAVGCLLDIGTTCRVAFQKCDRGCQCCTGCCHKSPLFKTRRCGITKATCHGQIEENRNCVGQKKENEPCAADCDCCSNCCLKDTKRCGRTAKPYGKNGKGCLNDLVKKSPLGNYCRATVTSSCDSNCQCCSGCCKKAPHGLGKKKCWATNLPCLLG